MHISVASQTTTQPPSVLCIDRTIGVAIILGAAPETFEILATLAEAVKATPVYALVNTEDPVLQLTLQEQGWNESVKYVLMVKGVPNGSKDDRG